MIKKFLLLFFIFFLGFFTHAVLFPNFKLSLSKKKILPAAQQDNTQPQNQKLFTYVSYANGFFEPESVVIERGSYLSVRNNDAARLMWLVSDNSLYTTARGYGKSEEVIHRIDEPKTFIVTDKNSPQSQLSVVVK